MKTVGDHQILEIKQSDWLKTYIDSNADKRKNAVNSLEKKSFNLISHSAYGKAMKKLKKIVNFELVKNAKDKFCFTEDI